MRYMLLIHQGDTPARALAADDAERRLLERRLAELAAG
jgi:hypothetical protein